MSKLCWKNLFWCIAIELNTNRVKHSRKLSNHPWQLATFDVVTTENSHQINLYFMGRIKYFWLNLSILFFSCDNAVNGTVSLHCKYTFFVSAWPSSINWPSIVFLTVIIRNQWRKNVIYNIIRINFNFSQHIGQLNANSRLSLVIAIEVMITNWHSPITRKFNSEHWNNN